MATDAANAVLPTARTNLLPTPTNGNVLTGNGSDWTSAAPAAGFTAPTLGSTVINSGATVSTISSLTLAASPTLGLRDTSAAFDVTMGATSSTLLSAGRALTLDVVNGSRTLKLGANLTLATDPGGITGALKSNGTGAFAQAACADLSNGATGCSTATGTSGATLPLLNGANIFSGTQTFGTVLGGSRTVSGTTDTLATSDCGTTIIYTSASAVTVTTLTAIVSGTATCSIALYQQGAGQVTISDGASATHVSAHGYTKTFGQYAILGLFIEGAHGSQYNVTGDGA